MKTIEASQLNLVVYFKKVIFLLGCVDFGCFGFAEDLDKLRETEMFGEMGRDGVWAVIANVMDLESLCRAFDGCTGVFHTSSVVDPGGLSGYSVSRPFNLLNWFPSYFF